MNKSQEEANGEPQRSPARVEKAAGEFWETIARAATVSGHVIENLMDGIFVGNLSFFNQVRRSGPKKLTLLY